MKKRIVSFLLVLVLFCGSSINVYASNYAMDVSFDLLDKANSLMGEVTLTAPKIGNVYRILFEQIGLFLNKDKWGDGKLFDYYADYIAEKAIIDSVDDYDEYLKAHLKVKEDENGQHEYIADSEMMNSLYDFSQDLISQSGWVVWSTHQPSDLLGHFENKCQYDYLVELVSDLNSDEVIVVNPSVYYNKEYMSIYAKFKYDGMLKCSTTNTLLHCVVLCYQWERCVCNEYYSMNTSAEKDVYPNVPSMFEYQANMVSNEYSNTLYVVTKNRELHRVYLTDEDYRYYSIGERPYYTTTEYNNYDSTVDNSTTITQTTIDNSVAYGDVYNYITNNYENPDGLTESQLRDILDDYLEELKNNQNNNDSGGSGSGSDNSGGGSGEGLGGFLSGLGSIGDAILAILGKLMEIIGQAIELVTVGFGDIVTVIPQSVGNLLTAVFPFFPEEWVSAITLSLLLGIVVGIIKMFK